MVIDDRLWCAALTCGVIAGCSSSNDVADDPRNQAQVAAGQTLGNQLSSQFQATVSGQDTVTIDSEIAGVLLTINNGHIAEAQLVLPLIRTTDVVAFANQEVSDHTQSNQQLATVLTDTGLQAQTSAVTDSLMAAVASQMTGLGQPAPQVSDLELSYVELQVMMHAAEIVLVNTMGTFVTNSELASFTSDAQDMLGNHLASAEQIVHDDFQ